MLSATEIRTLAGHVGNISTITAFNKNVYCWVSRSIVLNSWIAHHCKSLNNPYLNRSTIFKCSISYHIKMSIGYLGDGWWRWPMYSLEYRCPSTPCAENSGPNSDHGSRSLTWWSILCCWHWCQPRDLWSSTTGCQSETYTRDLGRPF